MTRILLVAAALSLSTGSSAMAGFVNGVERFDGTRRDTDTWFANVDLSDPDQTTVTQNDSLTLHDDVFPNLQYQTRQRLVGVGDAVRVDINHLEHSGGLVRLRNEDSGNGLLMQIGVFSVPGGFHVEGGFSRGGSGSLSPLILPGQTEGNYLAQQFSDTLTYEIKVLSRTRAQYSAYDPATGALLGRDFENLPFQLDDKLAIVLETDNATARFDNVTIVPGNPIPLPPALWPAGAVLASLAGVRAWRARR
jgi:hypothetical protein